MNVRCFEYGCFEWDLVLDLKKLLNSTSYIINAHDLYFWGVLPPSPFTPQFQCPWIPFPSFAWVGRDTPVISSRINYFWWNTQQHFWYLTTRIFSLDLQQIIRQCSNVSTGVQFVISNSDFAPNLLQQCKQCKVVNSVSGGSHVSIVSSVQSVSSAIRVTSVNSVNSVSSVSSFEPVLYISDGILLAEYG